MLRFYEFRQVKMMAGKMVHCFLDERHYIEMSFNGCFGTVVHDARYNEVVASISQCTPCYDEIGCRVGVMMDSTLEIPEDCTVVFPVVHSEFGRNHKLWHYIEDGNYVIEHNLDKNAFEGCYDKRTGEYFEYCDFKPLFSKWGKLIAITAKPVVVVTNNGFDFDCNAIPENKPKLTSEERIWLINANAKLEMFENMNGELSPEAESLLMDIAQFCISRNISPAECSKICSSENTNCECF